MLQEMKLLKGRLIGDLITGNTDLAGQQHTFKSWNWKPEWFSNKKMNPVFAGHSAAELLTRKKGRHWQNWVFKKWDRWEEKYGRHVYTQHPGCTMLHDHSQPLAETPAVSRLRYTLQLLWFCFSVLWELRLSETKAPGKLKWGLNEAPCVVWETY